MCIHNLNLQFLTCVTINYLFTLHKFITNNANWWLEACTDDIKNMDIGNGRSNLYPHSKMIP